MGGLCGCVVLLCALVMVLTGVKLCSSCFTVAWANGGVGGVVANIGVLKFYGVLLINHGLLGCPFGQPSLRKGFGL